MDKVNSPKPRSSGLAKKFGFGLLDRYVLTLMAPPMLASFAVMLAALLLYRAMQIFYQLSQGGGQYDLIFGLIGNLLPHYLGLAIPAAFFISIFLVVAKLGDNSEIDALLGAGVSIDRLSRPFMLMALAIGAYSLVLMGYIQPLSRYGFNMILNKALSSNWDARVQPRAFTVTSDGLVLTAEDSDISERRLRRVFVRRLTVDGHEQVITAEQARLYPSPDGRRLTAVLEDGRQVEDRDGRPPIIGGFDRFAIDLGLAQEIERFRSRGAVARELTMNELLARMSGSGDQAAQEHAASEFYTRIVRSISALLLPLLAVPLGMAAKRGKRGPGLIVAALILLFYEHAIDFGQALADLGHVAPAPAVWGPFAVFCALCVGLYAGSRQRPGDTPFTLALEGLGEGWRQLRGMFPKAVFRRA
jgi:lipopolysaccharide export system permease protein